MASHAPQPFPRRLETGPDGPVEHLVAYPCQDAADHRRVDHHVDLYLLAGGPRERLSQLLAPLQGERDGRTHLRDHVLSPLRGKVGQALHDRAELPGPALPDQEPQDAHGVGHGPVAEQDRKSTRLNSSHITISYAVFCLKKKKKKKKKKKYQKKKKKTKTHNEKQIYK